MVENTPEEAARPTPGPGDLWRQRWHELYEQGRADRREAARLRAELEMAAARYDMLVADLKRHRRALAAVQALVSEMLAREQPGDRRLEGGMHHADAILGGLRPRRDPALPVAFPEQYDRQPYAVPMAEVPPDSPIGKLIELGAKGEFFLPSPSQVGSDGTGESGGEPGKSGPA